MGLEIATFINSLNSGNPDGADLKSQGDDHFRLIKSVLKATFPNATRAYRFPTSKSLRTSSFTVEAALDDQVTYPVSSAAGVVTVTLPNAPAYDGYTVKIVKYDFSSKAVIVDGGANLVNGADTFNLVQTGQGAECVWSLALGAWICRIDAAVPKGAELFTATNEAPFGYVLMDGGTIGNAASAGSTRANADCLGLFEVLYTSCSNTICPVSGGRTGDAAADFAANKTLTLLDGRGRTIFGKDNMGGSTASRLTAANGGVDGTVFGNSGGNDAITFNRNQLPNASVSVTITDPGHSHSVANVGTTASETNNDGSQPAGRNTGSTTSATTGITASFNLNGNVTQAKTKVLNPGIVTNLCLKL